MKRKPKRLFRNRPPRPLPAYAGAVIDLGLKLGLKPGSFTEVAVIHDDDCSVWKGGACDCDFEVKTMAEVDRDRAERN